MLDILKALFEKAINACKDDSKLILIICAIAVVIVFILHEKGVVTFYE